MTTTIPSSLPDATCLPAETGHRARPCHLVSWGAIFAGLVATLALQFLFMLLGAGLGLAMYSPLTDAHPFAAPSNGAIVIEGISIVISLWFGGWIAGRFTPIGLRATGCLHGFCVWCAATVTGVALIALGAGWAMGDLSKIVGGGLSMAGKPAAALMSGASDAAKDALKQSSDTLSSFTDEAMGKRASGSNAADTARAKREIGMAIARLFNPAQEANKTDNRAAAVKALTTYSGMSAADADQMVTDWTTTEEQLKADLAATKAAAETKAREAAEEAKQALTIFSLCAFAGFLLGAISATCGGKHGAKYACRCENRPVAVVA